MKPEDPNHKNETFGRAWEDFKRVNASRLEALETNKKPVSDSLNDLIKGTNLEMPHADANVEGFRQDCLALLQRSLERDHQAEQPDQKSPMELLKLLGYINAMIGYCQSLRVGTVITEWYMQRMNEHYIPSTQKACMLIAEMVDKAQQPMREAVTLGNKDKSDAVRLMHAAAASYWESQGRHSSGVTLTDMLAGLDALLEHFELRRRGTVSDGSKVREGE